MLDLFLQFMLELIRALLVDELSKRVRGKLARRRGAHDIRHVFFRVHRRTRDRLVNRLLTETEKNL
jgi:hypothetical protein